MGMSREQYAVKVVVGLIAFSIGYFYVYGRDKADVKQEAIEVYTEALEDRALAEKLVNRFHDECFELAYSRGGRRKRADFDPERYVLEMDSRIQAALIHESPTGHAPSPVASHAPYAPHASSPPPPPAPQLSPWEQSLENARGSSPLKLRALTHWRDDTDPTHVQTINDQMQSMLNDNDAAIAMEAFNLIRKREPSDLELLLPQRNLPRNPNARRAVAAVFLDVQPETAFDLMFQTLPPDEGLEPLIRQALEKMGPAGETKLAATVSGLGLHAPNGRRAFAMLAPIATEASLTTIIEGARYHDAATRDLGEAAWQRIDPDGYDPLPAALRLLDTEPGKAVAILADVEPDDRRDEVALKLYNLIDDQRIGDAHRDAFARALGSWANDQIMRNLVNRLSRHSAEPNRAVIAAAVASRKLPETIRPMLELIVSDWDAVHDPLVSMGEMIEPDVLQLARHDDVAVRIKVADLLGYVSSSEPAKRELVRLARNDKNPQVRKAGRWAYNLVLKRSRGEEVEITDRPTDTLLTEFAAANEAPMP